MTPAARRLLVVVSLPILTVLVSVLNSGAYQALTNSDPTGPHFSIAVGLDFAAFAIVGGLGAWTRARALVPIGIALLSAGALAASVGGLSAPGELVRILGHCAFLLGAYSLAGELFGDGRASARTALLLAIYAGTNLGDPEIFSHDFLRLLPQATLLRGLGLLAVVVLSLSGVVFLSPRGTEPKLVPVRVGASVLVAAAVTPFAVAMNVSEMVQYLSAQHLKDRFAEVLNPDAVIVVGLAAALVFVALDRARVELAPTLQVGGGVILLALGAELAVVPAFSFVGTIICAAGEVLGTAAMVSVVSTAIPGRGRTAAMGLWLASRALTSSLVDRFSDGPYASVVLRAATIGCVVAAVVIAAATRPLSSALGYRPQPVGAVEPSAQVG